MSASRIQLTALGGFGTLQGAGSEKREGSKLTGTP